MHRINVSAAFFLSIEFQETGYLAYRMHKAAFGDETSPDVEGTVPAVRLIDFLFDARRIGEGVQVNVGDWRQQLEENKNAYALEFVRGGRFLADFPAAMTAEAFVAKLAQNTGAALSPDEKAALVSALGATPADAALMQYYGYLRRNPDDAPEPGLNFGGWKFWLDKLDQFNGNFINAEMVKAFVSSDEYRRRFGQ